MDNKHLESVLPVVVASLVDMIITQDSLSEDIVLHKLYSSSLYAALENEETKVWHYSVAKLYELYQEEIKTGKLELPGY